MTRPTAIDPTHPESKCQRCGEGNIVWHAPSPLWNAVMRNPATGEDRFGLVCPVCFVILAEEAGLRNDTGRRLAWCLRPDDLDVTGLWTDSSGRIWDSGRCLWVEPGSAEATAAAEQRLRERIEALKNPWPNTSEGWNGFEQARDWAVDLLAEQDDIAADIRQASTGGPDFTPATWPSPASPRQGEPVDVERLRAAVGRVIDRWYKVGLLRFNSRDDGSDDLILRDEIVKAIRG